MLSKDRLDLCVRICERAEALGIRQGDRISALMDLESADRCFNLRLEDWLAAEDFDFMHDFTGIQNNINRREFPSDNFGLFVPRFAAHNSEG